MSSSVTRSRSTGTPRARRSRVIAAELGVSEATLSAWCKAAGVAIRHRRPDLGDGAGGGGGDP